jgi:hypothetical protein
MVSSRLFQIEISSFLKNERTKLVNVLGIDKIKSFPAFIGFTLGAVFIIAHWFLQSLFLVPWKVIKTVLKY